MSIIDKLAKMSGGTLGTALSLKSDIEALMKSEIEKVMLNMNLARQEEIEVIKDMVCKLQNENKSLKAKIETLENK